MINIAKEERYIEMRNEYFKYFQDKYKLKNQDIYFSDTKRYKLEVHYYQNIIDHNRYSYSHGIVTNMENKKTISIKRNIGHFIYKWIIKDNKEYLLCGQDYQGYTIVDLDNLKIIDFVPEEVYSGKGFCWASINTVEDDRLIVEGCIWAHEYERITYDFSNPLELPYKIFEREVLE